MFILTEIERGRGRVGRGKRPKESDLSEPPVARGSVDQAENLETEIERGRGRVSRGKRPAESDSSEPPLTCFFHIIRNHICRFNMLAKVNIFSTY